MIQIQSRLLTLRSLVMVYVVLLVTGLCGNILIICSVLWHESMRTARNVFITTLAISDLILCLFTMPTTLWEVRWNDIGYVQKWCTLITNWP